MQARFAVKNNELHFLLLCCIIFNINNGAENINKIYMEDSVKTRDLPQKCKKGAKNQAYLIDRF